MAIIFLVYVGNRASLVGEAERGSISIGGIVEVPPASLGGVGLIIAYIHGVLLSGNTRVPAASSRSRNSSALAGLQPPVGAAPPQQLARANSIRLKPRQPRTTSRISVTSCALNARPENLAILIAGHVPLGNLKGMPKIDSSIAPFDCLSTRSTRQSPQGARQSPQGARQNGICRQEAIEGELIGRLRRLEDAAHVRGAVD